MTEHVDFSDQRINNPENLPPEVLEAVTRARDAMVELGKAFNVQADSPHHDTTGGAFLQATGQAFAMLVCRVAGAEFAAKVGRDVMIYCHAVDITSKIAARRRAMGKPMSDEEVAATQTRIWTGLMEAAGTIRAAVAAQADELVAAANAAAMADAAASPKH